jgi:plasmid stabilization system protein ParE
MRIEFSKRATADIPNVATDSRAFGESVASAVEARIRQVLAHIAEFPEAAPRLTGHPHTRVIPLVRYPYRIFYSVLRTEYVVSTFDMSPDAHGCGDRSMELSTSPSEGGLESRHMRLASAQISAQICTRE